IAAIKAEGPALNPFEGPNKLVWPWNDDGRCTGPQRVRHFIWFFLRVRLMTNFERFRRYLTDDSSRFLCGHWQETALHAVRDCPMAAHGRRKVIPNNAVNNFFAMDLTDSVKANPLNLHDFLFDDVNWPTFSGIICWRLWKNQNRLTLGSHHDCSISIVNISLGWAKSNKYRKIKETTEDELRR
ncbi:hypothetical protein Gotri_002218, partial [Gossypium trilobum]|nr:hypothetical protein [Gossypium trilobum]